MNKDRKHMDIPTRIDIANLIIACLALVISACALIYTYYTDKQDNTEVISIIGAGFGYNDTLSYDSSGGYRGQGVIDGINYSVIITNNSKQTVAIVSSEVQRKNGSDLYSYSGLVNEIRVSDNKKVTFPMTLGAGESILLTFEINTLVPSAINMMMIEQYGTNAKIPYDDIKAYLGKKGRDIFGNEVDYVEYSDGVSLVSIEDPRFPVYVLKITSGRGNDYFMYLTQ